jgi:hypothetical protein
MASTEAYGSTQPARWYTLDGEECYERLRAECKEAIEHNKERRAAALEYASVYEGVSLSSFGSRGYGWGNYNVFKGLEIPIVRNTCRAIVRTALSKIAAPDNPLPQFMTTGGDWAQRIKNIKLDHMVEAEMDQPQGCFDSTHEAWRHGVNMALAATGSVAVFVLAPPNVTGPHVELDDTLGMRIEYSGRHGRAISCVRTYHYAASELCERFPECEADIYANETPEDDEQQQLSALDEGGELIPGRSVAVRQGWWCAAGERKGRVVWVLDDGTCLWDEEYEPKELPCGVWHFERSLFGEWGTPLTHTIYHQCVRINEIVGDVDKAERNSPQGFVFHTGDHNAQGQLSNARGWNRCQVDNMNDLPVVVTVQKYASQSIDLLNFHEQGAYNASGVSEGNVAAKKSVGTTSGRHEHMIAALFTERFADQERSLTRVRAVTTGRLFVHALRELAKRDKKYRRVWRPKNADQGLEEITAADLDLDADKYVTSIAAVTEEKDSPKDRAEKAYEQLQLGEITPSDYTQLLMHFDEMAAQEDDEVAAQKQWIDEQIGKWLHASDEEIRKRDFYQSPSKWFDPAKAQKQVSAQWITARSKGAPRNRLAFFELFLSELQVYQDRQKAANQPLPQPQLAAPAMQTQMAIAPGSNPVGGPL